MSPAISSSVDYYVYYTVAPDAYRDMRARVDTLFAAARERFAIQPRLQIRVDQADGNATEAPQTWMEIYPNVPCGIEDFATVLTQLVETAGLAGTDAAVGARHLECFADAPPIPCA